MSMARLEDVSEFILDGTHGSPVRTEAGVPVLSAQNVKGGELSFETGRYTSEAEYRAFARRLVPKAGDVLLTIVGTIGRAAVLSKAPPLVLQRSVAVIRPKEGTVHPRFLYHATQAQEFQAQLQRASNQSSQAGVYLGKLKNLLIPVPPLEEQRRIAGVLDRAAALRVARQRAFGLLESIERAVLFDAVGDLARNERRWRVPLLGDIAEVKGGKRLPKGEEYSPVPTPFRYIRVTDLQNGMVEESQLVYLKPDVQAKIARYTVHEGDIIISIAGSIGLVAPVGRSLDGANLTENAAKLVAREPGEYDPVFLAAILRSDFAQAQISSNVGQVTIGKLALFRIEKLRVPLPPLDVQRAYRRRIESLKRIYDAQNASLSGLDALFVALQAREFNRSF